MTLHPSYPAAAADRSRWILGNRPDLAETRQRLSLERASGWILEEEPDAEGVVRKGLTVFLTNSECPWHCLMCDLWKHTTLSPVPYGAIPRQIDGAFHEAGTGTLNYLKLYNAGSFFDSRAIPPADLPAIAGRVRGFRKLVVECHPRLVGDRCVEKTHLHEVNLLQTINSRFTLASPTPPWSKDGGLPGPSPNEKI